MYYEINVARTTGQKNWRNEDEYTHLFATAKRSLTSEGEAKKVWNLFKRLFPSPEYILTITYWEKIGHPVNFESNETIGKNDT